MIKYIKASANREFESDCTITITKGLDSYELGFDSGYELDEIVRNFTEIIERNFGTVYFDESEPDFNEIWEYESDYLEGFYETELSNAEGEDYYDELASLGAYEWASGFSFGADDFGPYHGSWGEWRKAHLG